MSNTKKIKHLPFHYYWGCVLLLTAIGIFDSVYLSLSHYRVYTDIGYKSFCAISKAINCDTVSQSPFSIFLCVPVPIWGVAGYSLVIFFVLLANKIEYRPRRLWPLVQLVVMAFCFYSIVLAMISTYFIHSFCILCIISYAVNLLTLLLVIMIRKRFGSEAFFTGIKLDLVCLFKRKKTLSVLVIFSCLSVFGMYQIPNYWEFEHLDALKNIPTGLTEDGHPWIGAVHPVLEITEFSDYQCFQCKKMHYFIRQLISEHPDKIRLIHRHFPMDQKYNLIVKKDFHVGSGDLALIAIYAASKGKFWEVNDILFEKARKDKEIGLRDVSERADLDFLELKRSRFLPKYKYHLRVDIWSALKKRIFGTPSFVIDGKIYEGHIPSEVFHSIFAE